MTSTYNTFVDRFKRQLREVADFGGEENTTMEVIIDSLVQSGIKDICDSLDGYKAEVKSPPDAVATKTTKSKSKKAAAASVEQSGSATVDKDTKDDKATKTKRVTAYNVYVAEQVKVNKITMKDAAASWKTMDEAARAPYVTRAKATNLE